MNITKKRKLVLDTIKENPGVQNDISKLIEAVWHKEGWDYTKRLYWNISRVTHPETITRRLRELHEAGLVEYSPGALKTRTNAFKKERDMHSGHESKTAKIVNPRVENRDGEWIVVLHD